MIETLTGNIYTRVSGVLGNTFTKLSFISDLSMNKMNQSSKRYGIIPKSASITDGVMQGNTIDQTFEFILTDGYSNGALAQLNDELKMQRIVELQDKALLIYRDLQTSRVNLSSSVMLVHSLRINDTEFLTEDKVAVVRFEIIIKYKV